MGLGIEELEELENNILKELPDKITEALTLLNRSGELENLLGLLQMDYLLRPDNKFKTYRNGKIVVIGESQVKKEELLAIAKNLGLGKERFEFCLDYEKAKTYEYGKLEYNSSYRVVMFGPIPHSTTGKGDSSSAIAELEKNKNTYPRIERLENGHELKITKSNFKEKLTMLIEEQYI